MKEQFEQEIFRDLGDNNYLVYADWLTEQGDPRGEFIRIQASLEDESLAVNQRLAKDNTP